MLKVLGRKFYQCRARASAGKIPGGATGKTPKNSTIKLLPGGG